MILKAWIKRKDLQNKKPCKAKERNNWDVNENSKGTHEDMSVTWYNSINQKPGI
jgi:hypothetical protein